MKLFETKCPNCGAEPEIDFEKGRVMCPYCGSSMIIEQSTAESTAPVMDKKLAKAKAKEEKKQAKLLAKMEKNKNKQN